MTDSNPKNERQRGNKIVQQFGQLSTASVDKIDEEGSNGVDDDLDSYELEALRSELSGQASDGWGEGFEQREIETDDCGKLYVSFYGAPNWSMKTEEEMDIPDTEVQDLDDGDISM